jgi:threonine dehydratase
VALVSERAITDAVAYLYNEVGQVVECSGAVAVAAWRQGMVSAASDRVTALVVTGGNIDDERLDALLCGLARGGQEH